MTSEELVAVIRELVPNVDTAKTIEELTADLPGLKLHTIRKIARMPQFRRRHRASTGRGRPSFEYWYRGEEDPEQEEAQEDDNDSDGNP